MTIIRSCPKCGREIAVPKPGLYKCVVCAKLMRVDGDEGHGKAELPFPFVGPIPPRALSGESELSPSSCLAMYSKFAASIESTQ